MTAPSVHALFCRILRNPPRDARNLIYGLREFERPNGSFSDAYRVVGLYTGRILKGEKPARTRPLRWLERDLEKIRYGTEFVLLAAVPLFSKEFCELDGILTKGR